MEGLRFDVREDPDTAGAWRAEAIDPFAPDDTLAAIFIGPGARGRALEYAAWKNGTLGVSLGLEGSEAAEGAAAGDA